MRRAAIVFLLALSLLICGCADGQKTQSAALAEELRGAISASNAETRVSGKYMLEITFEGVTLYYALGDAAWDSEKKIASVIFTQTYLGDSSEAENYFSDGKVVSVDDGVGITVERDADEIFSKFPYARLADLPSDIGEITEKTSSVGRTLTLTRSDTASICDAVVGSDIFTLVGVLKKPQADKTQYSDTVCTYTVADGKIAGYRYEFDIKLFDTPAYIPGYSVPEEEYTLDLHVVAKMTYEKFGDGVTVPLYEKSESEENSQISS